MTALDDAPVVAAPGRTDDVVLAERTVLAAMIASRTVAEELLDMLAPDCFGGSLHRAVYGAVRWLAEESTVRDAGTLRTGAPDGDAGVQRRFAAVLGRLAATEQGVWRTGEAAVILGSLTRYADPWYQEAAGTVLRAAAQRRTVEALDSARVAAARPGFDAFSEQGDMIRNLIGNALGTAQAGTGVVTAAELFLGTMERLESADPPGTVQFPWADLRRLIPWLRQGQLITIAARPSVGKSACAGDIARHAGIRNRLPVALFTMEMSRDEVMDRFLAAEAGVPLHCITTRDLEERDWDRLTAARERFAESKILIDDSPQVTLAHIRARLRGMARTEPAQLVIVDYLQLMAPAQGGENRQQEVSALVGGLKAVAREFAVPLVMLCQLNRGPEQRSDKRPVMSDARESGSIENDSDVFIMLHRDDYYDPESPRAGEADLIVGKNRNGPRATVTVGWQAQYARFVDLAHASWSPSSSLRSAA